MNASVFVRMSDSRYYRDGDYRAGWDAYQACEARLASNGISWTQGYDDARKADKNYE